MLMELNGKQLKRLYKVLDFIKGKIIVRATLENNFLKICYMDSDNVVAWLEPIYFAKHSKEDIDNLNYILNGKK